MEDMHMVDLDGGCHDGRLSNVRPRYVRFGVCQPAPPARAQRPSPLALGPPTRDPPPALPSHPESCMSMCGRAHTHVRCHVLRSAHP